MRLICFGDSWTAGHGVETDIQFKEIANPTIGNFFITKLRKANCWPRWLANKFDCVYVNCSECGRGNYEIYDEVFELNKLKFLKEDDIIIVMFSYPYRDNVPPIEIYHKFEEILKSYKHFYFNAFYPLFKNENFDTNVLPSYFINPNGCVADVLKEYELQHNISIWEYNSRSVWNDEKNFWEGDYHPNLLGYKIIAEFMYNKIIHLIDENI